MLRVPRKYIFKQKNESNSAFTPLCAPSRDRELEIFSHVTRTAKLKKSSDFLPLETHRSPFPSAQDICEHQMLLPVSPFPTGFFPMTDWSLCYPSGTAHTCRKQNKWRGLLFILSVWKYHLSIPIVFRKTDINTADSLAIGSAVYFLLWDLCSAFSVSQIWTEVLMKMHLQGQMLASAMAVPSSSSLCHCIFWNDDL